MNPIMIANNAYDIAVCGGTAGIVALTDDIATLDVSERRTN